MELPLVERRSERRFRFASVASDLHLAKLVRERLARPCDVAIDLCRDLVLREGGVALEVVDRLLSAPTKLVDACVDNQATGTPHFVGQPAEILVRRLVNAHHGT